MRTDRSDSLWGLLRASAGLSRAQLIGPEATIPLRALAAGSSLGGRREELRNASVLLAAPRQMEAALALIELDGIARRIVIMPPDVPVEYQQALASIAEVDATVGQHDGNATSAAPISCSIKLVAEKEPRATCATEWVLLTSGTTGIPKMAQHSLSSLIGAIAPSATAAPPPVWSTFYDIRRYGGLQVFLRATLAGASMVLADGPVAEFLSRAASSGVTHISGTPSHWRSALMSPQSRRLDPRYVRLSGEIVDQAILDRLRSTYPTAAIVHAFASTEAGVAFEVADGRAGFPSTVLDTVNNGRPDAVQLKIVEGSLRIRSSRTASRYLGESAPLTDADGYIDTRDMVEFREGRYYFAGRRDGIINIGGMKVHPEEVEAVINRHPRVQGAIVKGRRNPITGAVIIAEVALRRKASSEIAHDDAMVKDEIARACRASLPAHKVPALIRIVPTLALTTAGKLVRS